MLCVLIVALTGCAPSANGRIPVRGTVTFDGEPLPSGTVGYIGNEGYVVALGIIQNGAYELHETDTQKGILPGPYRVRIESWIEEPGSIRADGSMSSGKPAIPARYFKDKSSGFTAEVTEVNRVFDFVLTSK